MNESECGNGDGYIAMLAVKMEWWSGEGNDSGENYYDKVEKVVVMMVVVVVMVVG